MKRTPRFWVLFLAGISCLFRDVHSVRATALIFAKSTTTTGTPLGTDGEEISTEVSTDLPANKTINSNLTGIPQLDYIYDPNLPKELNGYNLSEYPFYERVPKDINFKCDGLHDGFYASVLHKCQVYHHCLYGTRYDFLCANYTAFDQKTFICHFVSEVDCVNSKKYWHRNDALYQAASTTTVKPVIVTPPPQPSPAPRRPPNRRRPLRRRRPQYDYYEEYDDEYQDYYEERPMRSEARRRRPRPRPRPIYEDEYEEYEDEKYERRGANRRPNRRNKDRKKSEDEIEAEDKPTRRSNTKRRQPEEDERNTKEKPNSEVQEDYPEQKRRRPHEEPERRNKPKPNVHKEEEEELPAESKNRPYEDRRRNKPKSTTSKAVEDDYLDEELADNPVNKPLITPASATSIYDKPRAAPKIKPPVPKNEASKYAYRPIVSKQETPKEEEEYYEEYEYEEPVKTRKAEPHREEAKDNRRHPGRRQPAREDGQDDGILRRPAYKPRQRPQSKQPAPQEEYDEYEEHGAEQSRIKESSTSRSTTTSTTTTRKPKTTTTTTTTPATTNDNHRPEAIVRIVKRPFLPSRGGNPYAPRGLQPVGTKASDNKTSESGEIRVDDEVKSMAEIRQKYISEAQNEDDTNSKPVSSRPHQPTLRPNLKITTKDHSGPRTTQRPKIPDPKVVLDENNEYDVTLNDALNPTLPNLPVRSFPIGFTNVNNDYTFPSFQRPRYVVDSQPQEFYQKPTVRQRFQAVSYSPQEHLIDSNIEYKGQFSTQSGQYRPRVTQAYYSSY